MSKYKNAAEFNSNFVVNNDVVAAFLHYINGKNESAPVNFSAKQLTGLNLILKSLIGRNLFDKDAYYPNHNESDNCVLKAIEVLKKQ